MACGEASEVGLAQEVGFLAHPDFTVVREHGVARRAEGVFDERRARGEIAICGPGWGVVNEGEHLPRLGGFVARVDQVDANGDAARRDELRANGEKGREHCPAGHKECGAKGESERIDAKNHGEKCGVLSFIYSCGAVYS